MDSLYYKTLISDPFSYDLCNVIVYCHTYLGIHYHLNSNIQQTLLLIHNIVHNTLCSICTF